MKRITRHPGQPETVEVDGIQVPDLWHLAMWLQNADGDRTTGKLTVNPNWSEAVIECWRLAHDLLRAVREAPDPDENVVVQASATAPRAEGSYAYRLLLIKRAHPPAPALPFCTAMEVLPDDGPAPYRVHGAYDFDLPEALQSFEVRCARERLESYPKT